MTEYDPHHDEHDDLAQPLDAPDHLGDDDRFEPAPLPPLDELGSTDTTVPDELHFPGDDAGLDDQPGDLDPAAPFPDDDRFAEWLSAPQDAGVADDPAADAQLREQLAAPPADPEGLPSSDALADWTLRRLDEA